jgi:nitrite reductase/ring-hydroxylating ferredoxin subunit
MSESEEGVSRGDKSVDSPATYITIARRGDLEPGQVKHIDLPGISVCLARVGDEYFAIEGECPHAGAFLGEGKLEGTTVTCPWHGLPFDVRTGKALGALADKDARAFDLQIEDDEIRVRTRHQGQIP